jgi:hypothetical protein
MLKGKGRVWKATGKARGHIVYIPTDLVIDSAYPFKERETVNIEIHNGKMIISKEVKA